MINNQTIFSNSDTIIISEYASCQIIRSQAHVTLRSSSAYILLFVMQGEVHLNAQIASAVIRSGSFIAVHKNEIRKIVCTKNTIIVEYTPMELLCGYLAHCEVAFKNPYSAAVPILPALNEWLKGLVAADKQADLDHLANDANLTKILTKYPRELMQELYVPFFAYNMHIEKLKKNHANSNPNNTAESQMIDTTILA